MVRDDSHNEDGGVNDAQKEGRGIISVAYTDDAGAAATVAASWKIQGNQGGEDIVDTDAGPVNNGGLFGERAGWYLPGYPDATGRARASRRRTRRRARRGTGRRSTSTCRDRTTRRSA